MTEISWNIRSSNLVNCKLRIYNKTFNLKNESINLLIYALSFILSFSNRDFDLTCNIVLLPDKKIFNNSFTPNEINSGMSSTSETTSEIYIWRLEECVKVIFHECIHSLKFSNINDTIDIINHYNNKYNYKSNNLTINETYTEIWARLFNCYFITKLNKLKYPQLDCFLYFYFLIEIERYFSNIQYLKIIQFLNNNQHYDINKGTNTIAYYIATYELLDSLNKFLKNRFQSENILYLKDENQFLNNLIENNNVNYSNKKINKNLYKTFRMTACELKI